ncbi:DUF2066 domain-containing protein [Terasakiella sp. A23]|uniref:DUF2066 domain-containing protein n=1 Tax=Terasakiella sp. FCG-A23 TaxID=3080561 RepID=UPI002953EF75|nr:DUF2066 domain-containing protein [Terasakiella sp. A23]MDV7340184.1 DUF2066 domain-containing protein [Terasakiella sp. A23]
MRQLFGFMVVISALFLGIIGANAASPFEISGVYVDVTAENVTKARKQALRDGQNRAFEILLKRLTLRADKDFLPWVEPANQPQYIRDFSVSGEKTSAVRYLATLTYHFKPDAIRNLLKARGIPFAETISKPVLVLPLFDDAGQLSLWDEPNPWSAAWSSLSLNNGLVPIALPLGDLADISGLSAQQAATGDQAALQNMATRYDVNGVLVAQLVVVGRNTAGEPTDIDLVVNRIGGKNAGRSTNLGITALENETSGAFLKRVAMLVSEGIEEAWKQDNLLQFGVADVLPVNLTIGNLQEWINVKKRLGTVAVVRRTELALLSRDTVQLNLHYIGNLEQLIGSLRQVDLDLTVQGESWALVNLGEGSRS